MRTKWMIYTVEQGTTFKEKVFERSPGDALKRYQSELKPDEIVRVTSADGDVSCFEWRRGPNSLADDYLLEEGTFRPVPCPEI